MAGRFTARRATTPDLPAPEEPSPALEGVSWTVFPEAAPAQAQEPSAAITSNLLLSDKLLDAKVRLHRRLIEEVNLSALEKLGHVAKMHPLLGRPSNEATGHLFIVNPFKPSLLLQLFSTHPPIEERIKRLQSLK